MRFSLAALLAMTTVALATTTPQASTTTGGVKAAATKSNSASAKATSTTTHSKNAGPRETAAVALGVMLGGMGLVVNIFVFFLGQVKGESS
ncbi:hypothetical protein BDP67DRAFT_10976 [Colletotrichum lupini]|nr:hypothetical protein BDP67DRAFT_10976 [Colletotrichum lupini]